LNQRRRLSEIGLANRRGLSALFCRCRRRFPAGSQLGDSIMTAIGLAPFCQRTDAKFTDLERLRVQECERVAALRTN
jgi:hypothetical protein